MRVFGMLQTALFCLLISCNKNQLGGNSKINLQVVHHGKAISGARVYVKFKTLTFPGTDTLLYDASFSANQEGQLEIKAYQGSYYIWSSGLDFSLPPPYKVFGGIPVQLRYNEELNQILPVSEGD